jgi:hypothetical protein
LLLSTGRRRSRRRKRTKEEEKWRWTQRKDKTTVGWRAFEVLKPRS